MSSQRVCNLHLFTLLFLLNALFLDNPLYHDACATTDSLDVFHQQQPCKLLRKVLPLKLQNYILLKRHSTKATNLVSSSGPNCTRKNVKSDKSFEPATKASTKGPSYFSMNNRFISLLNSSESNNQIENDLRYGQKLR